jgi:hypothetical protein
MDEETRKEVLFVLDARLNDIREWKQEQWRYAYTAMIALTGLFATLRVPATPPSLPYRWLVVAACCAIAAFWLYANESTERALERSREGARNAWALLQPVVLATRPGGKRNNAIVPVSLRLAVLGEAAFVIAAAWAR